MVGGHHFENEKLQNALSTVANMGDVITYNSRTDRPMIFRLGGGTENRSRSHGHVTYRKSPKTA